MNLLPIGKTESEIDSWCKENGWTCIYNMERNDGYGFFKTGTLMSKNNDYPSGLIKSQHQPMLEKN